MIVGNKVLGVIATYHPEREYVYSHDDLDILQSMAIQAAIAIDNARMFYDVNQRLSALVNFEQELTSVIHLGENRILELIHEQVSQLIEYSELLCCTSRQVYRHDPFWACISRWQTDISTVSQSRQRQN